MNFKGTLPTLILEALVREPNHGYRIAQQIKERSEGVLDFKEGTLYPALHKLQSEGMVESYESIENGRPRRYYQITASGRETLAQDRAQWLKLSQAVTTILGEA
ncbi:MAG: PadR family transcriptional regulator [Acidobacteria bacterium]|nr:PadR family transcriptional regulator [Acidobacteriota bacterium]